MTKGHTMKTTDEILASWETEGAFADWYAIDAYDPMSGEVNRLFVGSEDDCDSMYKGYYLVPQSTAHAKFYRYSIISTEDAHAFFSGIVTELDERSEYTITEAAEQLGVTRQRVHDLIMRGKLDAHKRGKAWFVYRYSIEARKRGQ